MIGTMFEAFKPFNPLFAVYGLVYAIVSFFSGINKAYYTGFFFSFGVISAGFLLSDFVTIISGFAHAPSLNSRSKKEVAQVEFRAGSPLVS